MQFRTLLTTASAAVMALGMMAGTAQAGDNTLFVEQVGSNNYLDSNQEGVNNETHATQTGSYNTGNASMIASIGNANNNKALLQQNGNRNSGGWSSQGISAGDFSNNTIGIVQDTNQNFAGLTFQTGTANNSEIFIRQTGANNNYVGNGAPIDGGVPANSQNSNVGNSANGSTLPLAHAGVDPGLLETSTVFSVPTGGSQNAAVHGTGNSVGIIQDGASNALALSVSGDGNKVGGSSLSGPVDLNSFTSGGFFTGSSTIDPADGQFGISGSASQTGNDNTGVIAINGSNNAVSFSQSGGDVNEVYVSGSNNLAIANQM